MSVVLGCLGLSYWASAFDRADWRSVVKRGERPVFISVDSDCGKTIVNWHPLPRTERSEWESTGKLWGAACPLGEREPPKWSSFWDDDELERAAAARPEYGNRRHDHAIGWPWRAFSCNWTQVERAASNEVVVRGGVELPTMLVDRGLGNRLGEQRAIPHRPLWIGLLLDVAVWSIAWAGLLIGVGRVWMRARGVRLRARAREVRAGRAVVVVVVVCGYLVLGLLTCAFMALVAPLGVRERSVAFGATSRVNTTTAMCFV